MAEGKGEADFSQAIALLTDAFSQLLEGAKGVKVRLMEEEKWLDKNAEKVAAEYLVTGLAMLRTHS